MEAFANGSAAASESADPEDRGNRPKYGSGDFGDIIRQIAQFPRERDPTLRRWLKAELRLSLER